MRSKTKSRRRKRLAMRPKRLTILDEASTLSGIASGGSGGSTLVQKMRGPVAAASVGEVRWQDVNWSAMLESIPARS